MSDSNGGPSGAVPSNKDRNKGFRPAKSATSFFAFPLRAHCGLLAPLGSDKPHPSRQRCQCILLWFGRICRDLLPNSCYSKKRSLYAGRISRMRRTWRFLLFEIPSSTASRAFAWSIMNVMHIPSTETSVRTFFSNLSAEADSAMVLSLRYAQLLAVELPQRTCKAGS